MCKNLRLEENLKLPVCRFAGEAWIFAGSRSFGIGVPQVGRVYVDR